ncbi:MAG: hypothetical protein WCW52_01840 [Elusimicrobiales bacterium]
MKTMILMVAMLCMAGGAYAEYGTIETLTKKLTELRIDNTILGNKLVVEELTDMFETGQNISWKELSGNISAQYDVQEFDGYPVTPTDDLAVVETAHNTYTVTLGREIYGKKVIFDTDEASGADKTELKDIYHHHGSAHKAEIKIRKAEREGKTYLVMKFSFDYSLGFSTPDEKGYALVLKK